MDEQLPVVYAIFLTKEELAALGEEIEKRGMDMSSGERRRHLREVFQKIIAARLALNRSPYPPSGTDASKRPGETI